MANHMDYNVDILICRLRFVNDNNTIDMRWPEEPINHYLMRTSKYADLEYLHGVEVRNFSKVRIKHGLDTKVECGQGHKMDTILK